MWSSIVKVVIGTAASGTLFLLLNNWLGYERTELLAFALLIGLSIALIKADSESKKKKKKGKQ